LSFGFDAKVVVDGVSVAGVGGEPERTGFAELPTMAPYWARIVTALASLTE